MECRVRQGTIHYEISGEGKPMLILHAMGTDHRAMSAWLEPIFSGGHKEWRRIYIDLPAHGRSRIDSTVRGTEDFLGMLLEFTDHILPNERFAVAGMSYGGYLAQGIIHYKMDQIDGVCLIAPSIQLSEGKRELPSKQVLEKDENLLSTLDPDVRTAFETLFVYQNNDHLRAFLAQVQPGRLLADRAFLGSDWRKDHYFFRFEPWSQVDELLQPALVVLGKQDSICGYKDHLRVLDKLTHATFAVLDHTGHMIPIERTSVLQSLTKDWLDRMASP